MNRREVLRTSPEVTINIVIYADGWLKGGDQIYRAVYGRNGIGRKDREGDGISPEGTWPLREVFYRPDRLAKPTCGLPVSAIAQDDAWCDVAGDPRYNQFVKLPHPVKDERLWRDDHLYDVIVVIGYNDDPVNDGKGSAIFLHVAREAYMPSTGCAAISLPDLLTLLPQLISESTLTFCRQTLKGEAIRWPYSSSSSAQFQK